MAARFNSNKCCYEDFVFYFAIAARLIPIFVLFAKWRNLQEDIRREKYRPSSALACELKIQHQTLLRYFWLASLSNGRTRIYRLVAGCRFWNVAVISYVHALHSCWAEATQLGPAERRAKKAEAQQLHFKYYISRNPTTLRLVAEK